MSLPFGVLPLPPRRRTGIAGQPPGPLTGSGRVLRVAMLLLAALPLMSRSDAGEWSAKFRAEQALGYTDNAGLDTVKKRASPVSTTNGSVDLTARTPRDQLTLTAAGDLVRYPEAHQENSDAQLISARVLRLGRWSELAVAGSFRRDNTNLDLPQRTGDSQSGQRRRLTWQLSPSLIRHLSARDDLELSSGWSHVLFPSGSDADGAGDNVDYDAWSASAGLTRLLTTRLTAGASLYASYFDSARQRIVAVGPIARLAYRTGPRQTLTVEAGPKIYSAETQQQGGADGQSVNDNSGVELAYAVRLGLNRDLGPRTSLDLALSHDLEPGGTNGEVVTTDYLRAALSHRLSQRLRLELAGLLQRQTGVDQSGFDDRTFASAETGLFWQLAERAEVGLSYRYQYEKDDGDSSDARSHAVLVSLGYSFPEIRGSW